IDQPDAKAVFRLRVTTASELTVVSNAALEGTATVDGKRVWTFAPTPRMSTYLLYLGVGPFDAIETTHGDVRIVAVAPPGKAAMARRALAMAGPLLDEYSTYYGMPYPLPKLHLVAVPDLWAGGMENWGAIVFPEIGLLWDDSTSPGIVRWAVETLSHEIAHQWFGDLVTTKTWDDLWLNESFATFVASKMEDRLHLRTDPWSEFLIRTSPGYFSDSYASTHPVRLSIHDPAEISQSTDDITYFKGANVVRMIETFLGEETFRRGVSAYLKRFAYANAEEDDLWRSLEEASGQPVRSVMRAWVDRAGFPVVRVHREDGHLTLRQERFTFGPEPNSLPPWPIPLRFRDGETMHRLLFDGPSAELTVNDPGHLVLNPGRTSFIRVWYDSAERARRISGLAQIEPFDRWAFMNDAFAFTLSGDYSLQDYLRAATAIREVADYPSVDDTLGSLRFLGRTVGDLAPVDAAGLAFLRAQRARLGDGRRAGEPDTDAILRQAVARGLVRLDPEFGQTLSAAFDTLEQLDPALRPAAHVAFAAYGGPNALDRLFDRMKTAPRQDDTEQAAMAVEGLRSEAAVQRALDRCMGEGLRTALIQYLVRSAVSNPLGRRAVWGWLQTNLRAFERKAEGSWMLSVLLEQSIPLVGIGNEERVREYFARETFPEGTNGVRRGLELLKVLGALRGRLHGDLGQAKP
ncbi:MAG TPA: M1 family aminopeptidase, partial [Thermoplasmata archaeon]|nr:M1 family aminopeptidase [Thermoplasmata archaeon]